MVARRLGRLVVRARVRRVYRAVAGGCGHRAVTPGARFPDRRAGGAHDSDDHCVESWHCPVPRRARCRRSPVLVGLGGAPIAGERGGRSDRHLRPQYRGRHPSPRSSGELQAWLTFASPLRPELRTRIMVGGRTGSGGLEVTPWMLAYGDVSTIAPARRWLWLHNRGVGALAFGPIDGSLDGEGVLRVSPRDGTIAPAGSALVRVDLEAVGAGAWSGVVTVPSSDPRAPSITVPVTAMARALPSCNLGLSTTEVDFLDVGIGETVQRAVRLDNLQASPCLVSGLAVLPEASTSSVAFEVGGRWPIVLDALESLELDVRFRPSSPGVARATVELSVASARDPIRRVANSAGWRVAFLPSFVSNVMPSSATARIRELAIPTRCVYGRPEDRREPYLRVGSRRSAQADCWARGLHESSQSAKITRARLL